MLVALAVLLAQASNDPTAAVPPGWIGTGLLGSVLAWLLFVHLPAKDKQLKEKDEAHAAMVKAILEKHDAYLLAKDAEIKRLVDTKDAQVGSVADTHAKTIKEVIRNCQEESKTARESSERHHSGQMQMLAKIHESVRESVHVTRNLTNSIGLRQQLADAFQSLEAPAWTKALDGTLWSWNGACERLFGWKAGEVVGKPIIGTIIPPERKDEEIEVLKKISDGQLVEKYETTRMHKDGRRVKVLILTSPCRDQTGRVVAASTIVQEEHED